MCRLNRQHILSEPTVIASPKEDKEQTIVAGEEELWYTTVKFNKEAKNPDQMTNFDQKSEYATVVIKTPDSRSLQMDLADEAEESNEICID
ncbi:hypothetical protein C0J50_15233 [Silurus asotus]|uniref:Uncharacterized protein n=1 Tax=Silurus asotus TaxID=30991 RepID=A0AAD5AY14_SILAS|nr:hypothetical protein C0J50_15233 [Silurus asotus]